MDTKSSVYPLIDRAEKLLATDIRYLLKGSFWLSGGQGISTAISLLMAIAFANLVNPTDYGSYKYLLSCAGLLSLFTLPGLNTAINQAVAKGKDGDFWKAFYYRLAGGGATTVIGFCFAIYYFLEQDFNLALGFFLIGLISPIMESASIYNAVLSGRKLFAQATIYNFFSQAISSIVILSTILITDSAWIILASYLTSYTFFNILFTFIIGKKGNLNATGEPHTIGFGIRYSFINILSGIASYIDSIILWHFLGPIQVATYAFAQAATNPAKGLLKSILNLALPKFATRDLAEIKKNLPKKMWQAFALIIGPVIALIFILPLVFKLLFPAYIAAIPYAQVLALTLIMFPEKLMGILFIAKLKEKQLYTLNTVNSVVKIILVIILIPLYGIWGAVWAVVLQQIFASLLSLTLFWQMKTN